ncbi:hypothetical protein L1987_57408 [Smallanthus sonchifolius]|uniref:Uncharacterized protein n=1 Tax=Smallanthus sonchifolius TaxID=185202 RepID=A0ACB9DCJ4_9ASTR|nr:hypothetical protein L1987_57408 [Smallanthus sonchifolius]
MFTACFSLGKIRCSAIPPPRRIKIREVFSSALSQVPLIYVPVSNGMGFTSRFGAPQSIPHSCSHVATVATTINRIDASAKKRPLIILPLARSRYSKQDKTMLLFENICYGVASPPHFEVFMQGSAIVKKVKRTRLLAPCLVAIGMDGDMGLLKRNEMNKRKTEHEFGGNINRSEHSEEDENGEEDEMRK